MMSPDRRAALTAAALLIIAGVAGLLTGAAEFSLLAACLLATFGRSR
jgi:hypothetical protein